MQRLQNPLLLQTLNSEIDKLEHEISGFRKPNVQAVATPKFLSAPNPEL
jgi:hypothetical protein